MCEVREMCQGGLSLTGEHMLLILACIFLTSFSSLAFFMGAIGHSAMLAALTFSVPMTSSHLFFILGLLQWCHRVQRHVGLHHGSPRSEAAVALEQGAE